MPKCDGKTLLQRFNERYKVDSKTGCWLWQAGVNSHGYGHIWTGPNRKRDTKAAHLVGWTLRYGPIPTGLELHHKCENRLCVNPDHLELLTRKEHKSRHAPDQCKRGHPFTPANTRKTNSGRRLCITCSLEQSKINYQKRKAARALLYDK